MKKYVTPIVAAAFLVTTPALAEGKLTVTTYGGSYTESQREAYYKPFEAEMGIPVQEEVASEVWPTVKAQIDASCEYLFSPTTSGPCWNRSTGR